MGLNPNLTVYPFVVSHFCSLIKHFSPQSFSNQPPNQPTNQPYLPTYLPQINMIEHRGIYVACAKHQTHGETLTLGVGAPQLKMPEVVDQKRGWPP
jgi:hypothetical protein